VIEFEEFKAYYQNQQQGRMGNWGGWQGGSQPEAPLEEDRRPTVYRVGKLPRELTSQAPWFEQLDRDRDGQVGLYEWKLSGRSVAEFVAMDQNGDGFLTAEEVLRYLKGRKKAGGRPGFGGGARAQGRGTGGFGGWNGGFSGGRNYLGNR
jgi:hypothetical protein